MSVMAKENINPEFYVVHPLFDVPEEKKNPETIGAMRFTFGARLSLMSLRVYLILMMGLAAYRTMVMAGLLG